MSEIKKQAEDNVWDFIYGETENKEELFKLKLGLLTDKIGENVDRKLKAKVRKAGTVLEVLSAYYEIVSAGND